MGPGVGHTLCWVLLCVCAHLQKYLVPFEYHPVLCHERSLLLSILGCMSLFIICSLSLGPVFGNMDKFVGLGVFVDTYPNEEKQHEVMASVRA